MRIRGIRVKTFSGSACVSRLIRRYAAQLAVQPADAAATKAAKAARLAQFTVNAPPATFVADLQAQVYG